MIRIFYHEPTRTNTKGRKIFPIIFSLLFVSCGLFTGPKVDVYQKASEEVDWSAAEKLTVTVAVPSGWGASPQIGTNRCFDNKRKNETPRKKYPFNVEFTPGSGYGFRGWLAFKSDDYSQSELFTLSYEQALENSLNEKGVEITQGDATNTGVYPATVTINIIAAITLVPFCDSRPQIIRSNPPLNAAISPFPYNQKISLEFNMAVKKDTAVLGGTIRISAVYRTGSSAGQPAGNAGDISAFFKISADPNLEASRIEIVVKDEPSYPASVLQLLNIIVEIGPNITNLAGIAMPSSQTISYLTDTSEAQKIYEAYNIRAGRVDSGNEGDYFQDAGTQWNNPAIDRRFNKTDRNTVYLRFTVTPPDGVTQLPNRIRVIERLSADLGGFSMSESTTKDYENLTPVNNIYSITHELQTTSPGIIQMIILPWYEDINDTNNSIQAQDTEAARGSGRYVSVVLDTDAPGLYDPGAIITGGGQPDKDGVYTFSENATLTLTLNNLNSLMDNITQGGISYKEAWNKPWTMDEWSSLKWRVSIGRNIFNEITNKSEWKSEIDSTADPADASTWTDIQINVFTTTDIKKLEEPTLTEANQYDLNVYFIDTMGNESSVKAGVIRKVKGAPEPVTALTATVNTAGNQITVRWTTPSGMTGAYVYVNESLHATVNGTGTRSSTVSVPVINSGNIKNGQQTSGVQRYDIKVNAYNEAGPASDVGLTVWNIPDMNVDDDQKNTVYLTQANIASALVANSTNNFALTENVTLSTAWTPVGTDTAAFKGKFYGNGYTITFNTTFDNVTDTGIFGYVQNAQIRDLTVNYAVDAAAGASAVNIGGLAGYAGGTTTLRNIIVRAGTNGKLTKTASNPVYMGGITGLLTDTASIENSYCALDITLTSNSTETSQANQKPVVGGIAGLVGTTARNTNAITNYTSYIKDTVFAGKVTGYGNVISVGGIAGLSKTSGIMQNLLVSGTVSLTCESTAAYRYECGGLIGMLYDARLKNNLFEGKLNFECKAATGENRIGGLAGAVGGAESASYNTSYSSNAVLIEECFVRGDITVADNVSGNVDGSYLFFGGVAGWAVGLSNTSKITFTNCAYEDGVITITKNRVGNGALNVGGFAGDVVRLVEFNNCRVLAKSITATIPCGKIGGFSGCIRADLTGCYTNFPLNVTFTAYEKTQYEAWVGGLLGLYESSGKTPVNMDRCYTAGKVTVSGKGINVCAGGLVGRLGTGGDNIYASIKNSYATGAVSADSVYNGASPDNTNYPLRVFAGGLVAFMNISNNDVIENCFATGTVIAQSNQSTTTTNSNCWAGVGGLVGYINSNGGNLIRNSAALGASVTVTGSTSVIYKYEGRVFGSDLNISNANNKAWDGMKVFYSDTYLDTNMTPISPVSDATRRNGESTPSSNFVTTSFWLGLNFNNINGGFSGISNAWNFTGIEGRGYPLLNDLGGNLLGGQ